MKEKVSIRPLACNFLLLVIPRKEEANSLLNTQVTDVMVNMFNIYYDKGNSQSSRSLVCLNCLLQINLELIDLWKNVI